MSISPQTDFYLDFQQFGDLKRLARQQSSNAAQQVAQQFEGLFVQQMLGAMRAASKIDQTQHSSYMDFYHDIYDKQVAQMVAGQGNLGVAKLISDQLPDEAGQESAASEAAAVSEKLEQPEIAMSRPKSLVANATTELEKPDDVVLSRVIDNDFAEVNRLQQINARWEKPHAFVADIWPEAQQAAQDLGTSARVLVAQAALETGWGKHTMKFEDGRNSYNLFGIKASPQWQGAALIRQSLEYRDGTLQAEASRFRAYASPAQSMADYVDFIRSSSRYQQALQLAGDEQAYVRELQAAGYATDPDYADKIIGILNSDLLQGSLASLDSGVSDHA